MFIVYCVVDMSLSKCVKCREQWYILNNLSNVDIMDYWAPIYYCHLVDSSYLLSVDFFIYFINSHICAKKYDVILYTVDVIVN